MIYCKMNAKSVTNTKKDKPKFTTTPRKVEKVEEKATTKKTRTKRVEETETEAVLENTEE